MVVMGYLILQVPITFVLLVFFKTFFPDVNARSVYIFVVPTLAFTILVTYLTAKNKVSLRKLFCVNNAQLIYYQIAYLSGLMLYIVNSRIITPLVIKIGPQNNYFHIQLYRQSVYATYYWWILFVIIFAPIVEELLFRSIVLCGLIDNYRPEKAVFVVSVMFAVYHMNPFVLIQTFSLGIATGILIIRAKSVFPCIVLHIVYNGCSVINKLILST